MSAALTIRYVAGPSPITIVETQPVKGGDGRTMPAIKETTLTEGHELHVVLDADTEISVRESRS
jgi:hypothetical protein